MAPITLQFIPFIILYTFAVIGYVAASVYVVDNLSSYFDKLHTYVINKGWL